MGVGRSLLGDAVVAVMERVDDLTLRVAQLENSDDPLSAYRERQGRRRGRNRPEWLRKVVRADQVIRGARRPGRAGRALLNTTPAGRAVGQVVQQRGAILRLTAFVLALILLVLWTVWTYFIPPAVRDMMGGARGVWDAGRWLNDLHKLDDFSEGWLVPSSYGSCLTVEQIAARETPAGINRLLHDVGRGLGSLNREPLEVEQLHGIIVGGLRWTISTGKDAAGLVRGGIEGDPAPTPAPLPAIPPPTPAPPGTPAPAPTAPAPGSPAPAPAPEPVPQPAPQAQPSSACTPGCPGDVGVQQAGGVLTDQQVAALAVAVGWPAEQVPQVVLRVRAESSGNPAARDYATGTHVGLLQLGRQEQATYLDPGASATDPAANLRAALRLWQARGWQPWTASDSAVRASAVPALDALPAAVPCTPGAAPAAAAQPLPPLLTADGVTCQDDGGTYPNGQLPASALCAVPGVTGHKLRQDAAQAAGAMLAAARADGVALTVTDSYRSLAGQIDCRARKGNLCADPGTSQHGWGLALDLGGAGRTSLTFSSPGYRWLLKRGPEFGWHAPQWARITGSKPEPWHVEFEGVSTGQTRQA
jgi:hypothetical protein